MQKHWVLLFLVIVILFACQNKTENSEQIIFKRLAYIFNLKKEIDLEVWKGFNDKEYQVPLIYYTDTSSYVANPTEKFLMTFRPVLVFKNKELQVYRLADRMDSLSFHMETSRTSGDSTGDYNFNSPFMNCSSPERTCKVIPEILSTEQWATMIIHEYFHGFQYKHKSYVNFFDRNITAVTEDSLRSIYKNNVWFKEKIDRENDFLLQAINSTNEETTDSLINAFFELRRQRRALVKQKLNFEIEEYEKCYETMEGTARYVEQKLYEKFATMIEDPELVQSDSLFHSYNYFENYSIEKDPWLYLTKKTSYFYATGFNIARLLDKFKIEYKSRLFKNGALSLEEILKIRNLNMK